MRRGPAWRGWEHAFLCGESGESGEWPLTPRTSKGLEHAGSAEERVHGAGKSPSEAAGEAPSKATAEAAKARATIAHHGVQGAAEEGHGREVGAMPCGAGSIKY